MKGEGSTEKARRESIGSAHWNASFSQSSSVGLQSMGILAQEEDGVLG